MDDFGYFIGYNIGSVIGVIGFIYVALTGLK